MKINYTTQDLVKDTKSLIEKYLYVEVTPESKTITTDRYNQLTPEEQQQIQSIMQSAIKVSGRPTAYMLPNTIMTLQIDDAPVARKMFAGFCYKNDVINQKYTTIS